VRLCWAGYREVSRGGNALGYMGASTALFQALKADDRVTLDDDAPVAIHFCTPGQFDSIRGKRNVLFTMIESTDVPVVYSEAFLRSDAVLCPSLFCHRVFAPHLRGRQCRVVPLGFSADVWRYVPRSFDPEHEQFRFLWCGAPNSRKGWEPVAKAWELGGYADNDLFSLTMKTTSDFDDPEHQIVKRTGNLTFDSRRLPIDELRSLFEDAHCLIAPSQGEGFGLIMLEAMASGLPVITVRHSAPPEFLRGDAYYAKHEIHSTPAIDGTSMVGAWAIPWDVARNMARVAKRYPVAVRRALRASKRAHQEWTWEKSVDRLLVEVEALVGSEAA
tara:strand:- start:30 stop:1022 length:993 start_codon:yes stop_codon:yes gene_type:complete